MTSLLVTIMLAGTPLAPISYPACFVEKSDDADFAAREVQTVKEARWCVVEVKACKRALMRIYRDVGAKETYVLSRSCR